MLILVAIVGEGGGGDWKGGKVAFPVRVLRVCWRIILQVTARSRLSVLTPKNQSEQEGVRDAKGLFFSFLKTLSAVIFFFFLRESSVTTSFPQHRHSVQLITGFALFLRFPPNESLVRSILSSSSSLLPTLPSSPSQTQFSEVRHFTNAYMLVFEL